MAIEPMHPRWRADTTVLVLLSAISRVATAHEPTPADQATDLDREGALSLTDLCPSDRETRNGYRDDDGCPDQLPNDILAALRPVHFTPDEGKRAEKGHFSRPMLAAFRRVIAVLRKHPDVKIEVSWHSDSPVTTSYGYSPTTRRVAMTRTFFDEKGAPRERLDFHAAGVDEPIASNRTARGRANNRRVEFTLFR